MKNRNLLSVFVSVTVLVIYACGGATGAKNDASQNVKTEESKLDPSLEYAAVLKAQDSTMTGQSWPRKQEVDLNDDGKKEVFLASSGYSRGADYIVYTNINNKWENIIGSETVAGSQNKIEVLSQKNNGWHDFKTMQSSGRDGMVVSTYTWNGKLYVQKTQEEVSMDSFK